MADQQITIEPEKNGSELNTNEIPSKSTASFDNLIFDCLEMIFKLLDLESILNVARTCKRLQIEANSYCNEKFNTKSVTLYHNFNHSPYIYVAGKQQIEGLKLCLAFLRCFGDGLLDLTVQWQTWAVYKSFEPQGIPKCKCHTALDQYINRYCAESLTTIKFYNKSEFSSKNYVKPFIKVDTVRLFHCGLAQQLPRFIDWFPNLRHLDINPECVYALSINMQLHFPHLQHLTIGIFNDGHKMSIGNLLHMNPQLQSLEISTSVKTSVFELLDMISGNPSISKLTTAFLGRVNELESVRFASEHPKLIELNIEKLDFKVTDLINLICQLNSLKKIHFSFQTIMDGMQFELIMRRKQFPWTNDWEYNNVGVFSYVLNRK